MNVIGNTSAAEIQPPEADTNSEDGFRKKSLIVQWCLFVATFAAFGAAAWYALIAAQQKDMMQGQWVSMVAQLVTMNETLTEVKKQTEAASVGANAAKSAAETSASQLELAERPWILIEPKSVGPLIFDAHAATVTMQFTLKNTGTSPAIGVWVDAEFYTLHLPKQDSIIERRRLCDVASKRSPTLGNVIFPGEKPDETYTFGTTREDIDTTEGIYHGLLPVALIVCVTYQPTFKRMASSYYVGAIYDLGRVGPTENVFLQLRGTQNFGAGDLRIRSTLGHGLIVR